MKKALNQNMIKRIYGGITNNHFMYWVEPDVIFIIPEGTVGYIITGDKEASTTCTFQYWLTFLSNLGINPDRKAKEVFSLLKEQGNIMNTTLIKPEDIHKGYKYSYMVTNEGKRYYFDNKLLKEFKKPQYVFDVVELNSISAAIVYEVVTDRYGDNYYNYCAVIMGVRYEKN